MDDIKKTIKKMKARVTLTLMNLKNLPIEKKVGYICLMLLCTLLLGGVAYIIYRYRSLIWALITACFLIHLYRHDTEKTPIYNFYADIDSVRHCCFEMICDTALIFDWAIPINEKSIDRYFVPHLDNMERYYFRVRKKNLHPSDISIYESRQIINDDLEHQYHLNQTTFVSPLTGLYLDDYIDRGTYVDMSVMPRNPSTYGYIQQKEIQYAHEYEKEQKPTEKADDEVF